MIDPRTHIRIARPSRDLVAAERFYVDGLELMVLYRASAAGEGEHDLLMLGWREAGWHFELTRDPADPLQPSPTPDDLFVLYLNGPVDASLVERLVAAGGTQVAAHNAYWDRYGVTIEDPDGYRLVLCERAWSNAG
ncbi:MAG TPA: VOC family protein [Thermomicrobiales bacterium]|nr:VOC family protein [Thermomicrobiales bacterium]